MSRVPHADTRGERSRVHEKKIRRLSKSPCGRPPSTPTGLDGGFDRLEAGKGGHRIRLWMRWSEVTTDTSGNSARIRVYKDELEYSSNGTDWFLVDRYTVPGKDDTDDNSRVHKAVKGIKGRLQYRYRVRAIDTDKCKSEWSAFFVIGAPSAETPPGPTNVRIYDRSVDRVVLDWDDTADPDDVERRRDDQTYFSAELSIVSNFNTIYKRDRHIGHTRWSVRIPDADTGGIFYGRVWSNNDTGDKTFKSLKIPGTFGGNSNPNAAPDFVYIKEIGAGASTCDPGEVRKHAGPLKPAWSRCSGGSPSQPSGAPKLVCDGCSYSTSNYAALFAEIGYIYGGSGGSFNVPDLRRRKVTGASSDAELGQNDGLTLSERDENHAPHNPHQTHGGHNTHDGHNPHGGHNTHGGHQTHGQHGGHNSTLTDTGNTATEHGHYIGGFTTGSNSNPVTKTGGTQNAAGSPHQHSIPSTNTNTGGAHSHNFPHNTRHDSVSGSEGHGGHSGHASHNEHNSGEHDYSGNVQGHGDHSTHNAHNEHQNNEHDSDGPGGKGHKPHAHHKAHFVICT